MKTLKEGAGKGDKIKFLQEAAIMGQFFHPNIVKLYGVVTEGEFVIANFFYPAWHFFSVLYLIR